MKPPPSDIDGAVVLATADLKGRGPTGRTTHVVGDMQVGRPAALAFAQYTGGSDVYLFTADVESRVLADTLHHDLNAAIDQAVFEFGPIEIRRHDS